MLSTFPHLTEAEFEEGCAQLLLRFQQRRNLQEAWLSVEKMHRHGTALLTITKHLAGGVDPAGQGTHEVGQDALADDDDDEEALHDTLASRATISYDVILSPVYQVPVLYFSIGDPLHRYPPTMTTLYEHLVPPEFRPQTETVGVIGGITIADHPITSKPVFFIHPCQTNQVMKASAHYQMTAEEYLMIWIGALGKSVGLNIPLAMAREH